MKYFATVVLASVLIAGCNPTPDNGATMKNESGSAQSMKASDVENYDTLRIYMSSLGPASDAGEITQPFLTPRGRIIVVKSAAIQVYEYDSKEVAEEEISKIDPCGTSAGTVMLSWVELPHFFHKNTLVALYVGSDESVLTALKEVFGEQFAGG